MTGIWRSVTATRGCRESISMLLGFLGSRPRHEVLFHLAESGPQNVGTIAASLHMKPNHTSRTLRELYDAGLVEVAVVNVREHWYRISEESCEFSPATGQIRVPTLDGRSLVVDGVRAPADRSR